jgi:signal transduction histidine kinase
MATAIDRRSRYLRDFATAVSHEFKTPLAGIRGALELLDEHGTAMSPEERRRFMGNAAADVERLSHLVGRLLELARADMAAVGAEAATDLATPLRRVADAMRSESLAIDLSLDGPGVQVAAPASVIEAVVTTLIENSAQAGAKAVRIALRSEPEIAAVTIGDDGPGVPAHDRDRLFDLFFTTRRAEGGTGLGLAIARSLLEASRASIEAVDSERGLSFEIRLRRLC